MRSGFLRNGAIYFMQWQAYGERAARSKQTVDRLQRDHGDRAGAQSAVRCAQSAAF